MKILMYQWNALTQKDINYYFSKHNVSLDYFTYLFEDKNYDDNFCTAFASKLNANSYDAVFSINYFPLVAEVCYKLSTKYISWTYDAPLNVRNITDTLYYPTNFVFLFDKVQAQTYRNLGVDTVFHLPLGVAFERFDNIHLSAKERKQYHCDLSFVGTLYQSTLPQILTGLSVPYQECINQIVNAHIGKYGSYLVDSMLLPPFLEEINNQLSLASSGGFQIQKEELSFSMATQITHQERLLLLELLSRHHSVSLYSGESHHFLENVTFKGRVDYFSEMPKLFKGSKLNLNTTLKCLQSGIPQRALDIMGCHATLFSNFQPELSEWFIPETDFIEYQSLTEAAEKAAFYLKHSDLATQIATNGYQKTRDNFSYSLQIKKIFTKAQLI